MGLTRISNFIGNNNQIYSNLISEAMFRTRCAIPCIIQSYNEEQNTVECQPAVRERVLNEDGSVRYADLPLLINVPVVFPSSAGFSLTFPLVQGDECLVVFSDLSIDNFWLHSGVQNPVEVRRHDLSDGIAIPCCLSTERVTKAKQTENRVTVEVKDGDFTVNGAFGQITGSDLIWLKTSHYHYAPEEGGSTSGPLGGDSE